MASSSHAQFLTRYPSAVSRNERLSFRLPAVDTSAAEARRRTRRRLAGWGVPEETRDNAQLVVSELVTNALRHTGSETVGCELHIMGTVLRVAVSSEGAGPRRAPLSASDDDENGRGLLLVCALARSWGVRPSDAGRGHVVWADLPLEDGLR